MDQYTIDEFWVPRLGKQPQATSPSAVKGWSFEDKGLNTFKEAPLTQSIEQFGSDADPLRSPVILVSAPGAVGKSTLARQIAFVTGSVYVDLAAAYPVGANTLSGGLVRSGIYNSWTAGVTTALIDGLDEAILRTTKEGFEAFLSDVAELSVSRTVPTVLFGRTGIVQDAWLLLVDRCDGNVAVLEIGYYSAEASIEFAEARLKASYPDRHHSTVDRQALELLVNGLRNQTASDGDRFAGYAPVLEAVVEHVGKEDNPSGLVSAIQQGIHPTVTLHSVVEAILDREQKKLENLPLKDPDLVGRLYSPEEQLDHLVARVYEVPSPKLRNISAEDAETYSNALENWVGTHPFLGEDTDTPSAVFQAVIIAHALKSESAAPETARRELIKGEAANPFLYAFYTGQGFESDSIVLPGEQIGVIYSSIRASLAQGETASLFVGEPDEEEEALFAEGEIELSRRGKDNTILLKFQTEPIGPICLGPHIKDAIISMPRARVEIGQSTEVLLVAPVDIQCEELVILAERVIVDTSPESQIASVFLQADRLTGTPITAVPVTRNQAKLFASWRGVETYPWNNFATELPTDQNCDPRVDEALRRFRKFVVEFRSHGNGGLARSKLKIESQRMTKGTGQAVLNAMVDAGVVTRDQARYYLHTGPLGELTGTTYGDCMSYQFGPKAMDFVQKALGNASV